ncbi:MAG: hydantoinase/oxoprolinase family protein [Asgard group archaeon]|nr:hydantoinase/oxoprolinase family protein [Asgard group archaeon]
MNPLAIAIDIGGTFTDIIVQDKQTGNKLHQFKVPTTPTHPEKAIISAFKEKLGKIPKESIKQIYHATTIATNAFLGQVNLDLPKTALITTKGFRDVLEIGRQRRPKLYDLFFERPTPIIPRKYRFEIDERLNYKGEVLSCVNKKDLKRLSNQIIENDIQSVAITLLHSYINPEHERQIKTFLEEKHPDIYFSASYDVSPEHREFERTSTTAINAILMPIVSRYVKTLQEAFETLGIRAPLYIMQSSGGVSTSEQVEQLPVSIIESGPSAGLVASRFIAEFLDIPKILSFDMGGTTAKAGTVLNHTISLTSEYEVGGEVHSGRITKGSGYPARFPFIDLAEISSGGGSIAWVDEGKGLNVGPISAGSDPGPACYGQKGKKPTITDANLLLGRLNPEGLLNKTFPIDKTLAKKSIKKYVADPLNLTTLEAGKAIIKIANINMSRILRIVTVERGLDPREFVLLAFGGAGPLHACALADELEMKKILIPTNPGLYSAMGLLYTNVKHSFVKSIRQAIDDIDVQVLETAFQELEASGQSILEKEGFSDEKIRYQRFADIRYIGQGFELLISLDAVDLQKNSSKEKVRTLFDQKHKNIYGYILPEEKLEIVNIRVNSIGLIKNPSLTKIPAGKTTPQENSIVDSREVFFDELDDFSSTPIYDRAKLCANNQLKGPAIIEQYDTTTVLPPNWKADIDEFGLVHISKGE